MQIMFDTDNNKDVEMLAALVSVLGGPGVTRTQVKTPPRSGKSTTAEKAAAAAPEPDPVVEEEAPAEDGGATMDDAVKLATELVSAGKAAEVKAALTDLGAKRVSELSGGAIGEFISRLS
jgi:hypothetical protein